MTDFESSYLGQLRAIVGARPLLCPCVRVLIEDDQGRVLLQGRGDDIGFWGIPGGNIEYGEDLLEAARRETWEETALEVRALTMFGYSSRPELEALTLRNGHVCHYHASLMHTRQYKGVPTPDGDEALELRWVDPDGPLPQAHPHVVATLEAYRRWRDTGEFQLI